METAGKTERLDLVSGMTGQPIRVDRVDVTGKDMQLQSSVLGPLESGYFRIYLPDRTDQ